VDTMPSLLDPKQWERRVFRGEWVSPSGGSIEVREPATGDLLGHAGCAAPADITAAVDYASAAQPGWAATPYTERAAVLRNAAALLRTHGDELKEWLIREAGAASLRAQVELDAVHGDLIEASSLPSRQFGEVLPNADPGQLSIAQRVPFGVVGVIGPFNFPMFLVMRSIAPALAVGNAVVLKAHASTPVSGGFAIARLFEEAGLPAGALHVLPGPGAEAGEALVRDPRVPLIAFTGSTTVGRRVGELCGSLLKRASLELGGNSAFIVLDDADVDLAASAGAFGTFFHQGQICMTIGRHLVHSRVAEHYLEALTERARKLRVGDPFREEVDLGPLINEKQMTNVERIVSTSIAAGAKLRAGGTRDGLFYSPTVLSDVEVTMPAFTEEIFGPVAPVTTFRSDAQAVELANLSEYGLAAGIVSASTSRALEISRALRVGMVHVNDQTVADNAIVPFGGMGASGNGARSGSLSNLEEFTQWQWLTIRDAPQPYPY
jgi:benzaldehyde dehydrogenase (NAD)